MQKIKLVEHYSKYLENSKYAYSLLLVAQSFDTRYPADGCFQEGFLRKLRVYMNHRLILTLKELFGFCLFSCVLIFRVKDSKANRGIF